MRVMLCGKSRFGYEALKALMLMPGIEIAAGAVSAARPVDHMRDALHTVDTPTVPLAALRSPKTAVFVDDHRVDLIVLANVSTFLNARVRATAPKSALCFHPSLLPAFRGHDAVRQQIDAGVTESGVTIFEPREGFDEGPIVWRRTCPVPAGATASSLYHDVLVPAGIDALVHAVAAVRDGMAWYRPQGLFARKGSKKGVTKHGAPAVFEHPGAGHPTLGGRVP